MRLIHAVGMDKSLIKTDPAESRPDQGFDDLHPRRSFGAADIRGLAGWMVIGVRADRLIMERAAIAGIDDKRSAGKRPGVVQHVNEYGVGLVFAASALAGEVGIVEISPSVFVLISHVFPPVRKTKKGPEAPAFGVLWAIPDHSLQTFPIFNGLTLVKPESGFAYPHAYCH